MYDVVHQLGQSAFRAVQPVTDFGGNRQSEQGHHAIGLDLEQTLNRAAGLTTGQALIEQEEARKSVVKHEIGEYPGGPIGNSGNDHLPPGLWRKAGKNGLGRKVCRRAQLDMRGHNQLARNR